MLKKLYSGTFICSLLRFRPFIAALQVRSLIPIEHRINPLDKVLEAYPPADRPQRQGFLFFATPSKIENRRGAQA
jgi:hypothetical protein